MKQGADLVASIHPAPPNELHAVSCDTALRVTRFSSPVRANELPMLSAMLCAITASVTLGPQHPGSL